MADTLIYDETVVAGVLSAAFKEYVGREDGPLRGSG